MFSALVTAKDLGFISLNLWKLMIVFGGSAHGTSILHVIVLWSGRGWLLFTNNTVMDCLSQMIRSRVCSALCPGKSTNFVRLRLSRQSLKMIVPW